MMEGRISRPDLAHGPRIVKLGALSQVECHQCEQGEIIKKRSHMTTSSPSPAHYGLERLQLKRLRRLFFFSSGHE